MESVEFAMIFYCFSFSFSQYLSSLHFSFLFSHVSFLISHPLFLMLFQFSFSLFSVWSLTFTVISLSSRLVSSQLVSSLFPSRLFSLISYFSLASYFYFLLLMKETVSPPLPLPRTCIIFLNSSLTISSASSLHPSLELES